MLNKDYLLNDYKKTMKKTYIQPTATVIRFDVESAVAMLAGSKGAGESINQSDDWSNERQWGDESFDWSADED